MTRRHPAPQTWPAKRQGAGRDVTRLLSARWEVVAARISMTMLMALTQTALFLAVATLPYFGLQLTGNWWLVVPLVVCGTLALMSLGLLIGSLTKTEESAGGLDTRDVDSVSAKTPLARAVNYQRSSRPSSL